MTGSILMLEAARLQLDRDPRAARESIEAATENLRESVEEIRRELREERTVTETIDLVRISAELADFSARHPAIDTGLTTDGVLGQVPQAVWLCVFESLRETLTNLLKHSDANRFRVSVAQRDRLLTVEFSDNGQGVAVADAADTADAVFVGRGIGLAAIEERALLSGGRAFFALSPRGFTTRLLFTLGERA
jgi:signal transduction histidine kinase